MLERFFNNPKVIERLRGQPLGPAFESFARSLAGLGYAISTGRSQMRLVADLGRWLARKQITAAALDERVLDRFLKGRRHRGRLRRGDASIVHRFLDHLRSNRVARCRKLPTEHTPLTILEGRYEQYLRAERGLTTATVKNYLPFVRRFLGERFGDGVLRLHELGTPDITRFVLRYAGSLSPGRAKLLVTALRSVLRFLLQHGEIEPDLAASVPTVAGRRRLSTVPKFLTAEEIQCLLAGCNRSTPTGRRDYAILLLLARLGLRAGEVVALDLDDIDWRAAEITISGKGLVRARLPLLADVGEALATYLRQDRPQCQSRRVFVRMKAPRRGFANAVAVSTIVRRALERARLQPTIKGAHLLRHSLATGMLRRGASMAEIAEVLRHRSASTTEIYAKVDFEGLRALAQPWPTNGGER